MSMLAEKKRKQKWSLNPRGKDWAEDGSKFGQKLLEKMGWSHGKGLGANEDGRTEHIKVAYKNDTQGMGFKDSDNQWTEHESNFSALLEALGGEKEPTEIKLSSLEAKSQNSKVRVHYRKFTRGKDLSRYSEKDLANIFGKKSLKEIKKSKVDIEEIKQETKEDLEADKNFSHGGLMSDYFKKKLPIFGRPKNQAVLENGSESESEQIPSFGFGFNLNYIDQDSPAQVDGNSRKEYESEEEARPSFGLGFNQETTVIKSTVSKNNNCSQHMNGKVKSAFVSYVYENTKDDETTPRKKKKDKQKRALENDCTNIEDTPSKRKKLEGNESSGETPVKKKKDKSKKKAEDTGLSNPAFDPLFTPTKAEKHILETIEESLDTSINQSLNDTVGQVAEIFEVQVQIVNAGTPMKRKDENSDENGLKKKKKKKQANVDDMKISYHREDTSMETSANQSTNEVGEIQKKKKKKAKGVEESIEEMDTSSLNGTTDNNENDISHNLSKHKKNKKKLKTSRVEVITANLDDTVEQTISKKKKNKSKGSQKGIENPFFNITLENDSPMVEFEENPYELKIKEKKKKKVHKNKENVGVENPVFNGEDSTNSQDVINEEYEVKRKDKSKKKKKDKEENKGLDNPALNLNDTIEESCDLMFNTVSTPVQISQNKCVTEEAASIQKVKAVARRKSVRFSDVTRERIIPTKEEIQNETLDDSRDILEIQGKLNDSADMTYIDKFIQKKKSKKNKNKGLVNDAFDQQANTIEENITSISKTLETYQAEIENDINEAKLKSVEIDDIMVGEVGNPDGTNEKLPDGTVKLKFKYANFKNTAKYIENLTGAKKSYKHLIKGDIVMGFKETNLHEIDGYAVATPS